MNEVLKCSSFETYREANDSIMGLGTTFLYYNTLNEQHYASTSSDILMPVEPAYAAMLYGNGREACVAYQGDDYHCITIGFPFECIIEQEKRNSIMQGLLNFLIK